MAAVHDFIKDAEEVVIEPPRPLQRELLPADPFPIGALSGVLEAAVNGIHDRIRAPIAIAAQSVLAAATLAVQGHANIVLPIGGDGGLAKPISCNFITVAATGERKSACDSEALWPVRKREAALRDGQDNELFTYANDRAAWDKAREVAIRAGKGNRAAIKASLDAIGPAPAPPLEPMLTCPEPTFEGLCKLFSVGFPSLGIFTAEGGQFIGGHGMSEDNKLKTAAALSGLWDGEPIRRVRAGDGAVILQGRRLATHLMAQPGVADLWFRDPLLADQGLLSRLLASAPDSAAGTRFHRDEQPETDQAIKRYGARVLSILETPPPLALGKSNELIPRPLPLSARSRRIWFDFHDYVEAAIAPQGELQSIRGLANKLPEHAARLAAVLTLVRNLSASEIAAEEMEAGISLAEHYAAEALRLFGAGQINSTLALAQRLLDWLTSTWTEPVVSLPDIYQRGLNVINNKGIASKLVGILEDHGWVTKIPEGATVSGRHRRDAWRIVRVT